MWQCFVAKRKLAGSWLRYLSVVWVGYHVCLSSLCCSSAVAADPPVEIEVIHEGPRSILAPQEWAEILGRVGFARVSIRGRRSGDALGVKNIGSAQRPRYRVTAFLRNDKIVLPPSSQFSKRELGNIKAWMHQLQKGGTDASSSLQEPFGLSAAELDLVRQQMAGHVQITTKGKQRSEVIGQLVAGQRFSVVIGGTIRQKLDRTQSVPEELAGLATGTALAALLRPAGLGLQPSWDKATWSVVKKKADNQVWPVGWDSDQSAARTVPVLGKEVETQVVTLPLNTALDQLADRMGIQILLDYRELEKKSINPKDPVSMRAGRFLYSAVIRHLLRQHKLTFAVRLDDSAQPFLWVSTFESLKGN